MVYSEEKGEGEAENIDSEVERAQCPRDSYYI